MPASRLHGFLRDVWTRNGQKVSQLDAIFTNANLFCSPDCAIRWRITMRSMLIIVENMWRRSPMEEVSLRYFETATNFFTQLFFNSWRSFGPAGKHSTWLHPALRHHSPLAQQSSWGAKQHRGAASRREVLKLHSRAADQQQRYVLLQSVHEHDWKNEACEECLSTAQRWN